MVCHPVTAQAEAAWPQTEVLAPQHSVHVSGSNSSLHATQTSPDTASGLSLLIPPQLTTVPIICQPLCGAVLQGRQGLWGSPACIR